MSQLLTKHPNRNLKFKSRSSKNNADSRTNKTSRTWRSLLMVKRGEANRSDSLPPSRATLVDSKTPSREERSQSWAMSMNRLRSSPQWQATLSHRRRLLKSNRASSSLTTRVLPWCSPPRWESYSQMQRCLSRSQSTTMFAASSMTTSSPRWRACLISHSQSESTFLEAQSWFHQIRSVSITTHGHLLCRCLPSLPIQLA